jgi:hypothetical protein
MRVPSLTALALATAGSLGAQTVRLAPQFVSYKVEAPAEFTLSEFAIPVFVAVPLGQRMTFDVGSAWASARLERTTAGTKTTSSISGPTDTQVRLNATFGGDFLVLTAGANLPTGRSTATPEEQPAAGLMGSDFLSFPVSNMGTGAGATGGIAIARPIGSWNLGVGGSFRRSAAYNPYETGDGTALPRYQPGDEYRVRAGIDRPFGTGQIQIGVTYSRFGDDEISGSIYNTGDRWLTQGVIANGNLTIVAWNLFRTAGTLTDGSISEKENITNGMLSYGLNVLGGRIEPSVEVRSWQQIEKPTGLLGTASLRFETSVAGFAVVPSVGYSVGRLATQSDTGFTTANLTGLRGTLIIRVR